MSMIILIPENVYNELMTGELPEAVSDVFCKKAVEIIDVADKYARYAIENIEEDFFDMIEEEIEDEYEADIDLLDAAETRIYHILRFCYIAKVSPMIETIMQSSVCYACHFYVSIHSVTHRFGTNQQLESECVAGRWQ